MHHEISDTHGRLKSLFCVGLLNENRSLKIAMASSRGFISHGFSQSPKIKPPQKMPCNLDAITLNWDPSP